MYALIKKYVLNKDVRLLTRLYGIFFVFLCVGFVAGNYARVLSGPHKGLQGKVGTCMCMYIYMYVDVRGTK